MLTLSPKTRMLTLSDSPRDALCEGLAPATARARHDDRWSLVPHSGQNFSDAGLWVAHPLQYLEPAEGGGSDGVVGKEPAGASVLGAMLGSGASTTTATFKLCLVFPSRSPRRLQRNNPPRQQAPSTATTTMSTMMPVPMPPPPLRPPSDSPAHRYLKSSSQVSELDSSTSRSPKGAIASPSVISKPRSRK